MIFDNEENLYGESVKNSGYFSKLNIAYYVVLGKKIYLMILTYKMTRCYYIMKYEDTIFYHKPEDIKKYEDTSGDFNTILFSIINNLDIIRRK
jgi:hypothetical protein